MMKKIFYTFIGIGLAIAGSVSAVMISVPSATQYGQTLIGNTNGTYTPTATSSLGLPTFASLSSYLSLSSWYATTTDGLAQGSTNKYFADSLVDTWLGTKSLGIFFSTTSADHWYTVQSKASSTLLGDTNTWSGLNQFAELTFTNATGTRLSLFSGACDSSTQKPVVDAGGNWSCGTDTSGGGGSGVGTIATSTVEVAGQIPFFSTNGGYPALLSGDSNLTWDGTNRLLTIGGGGGSAFSIFNSGADEYVLNGSGTVIIQAAGGLKAVTPVVIEDRTSGFGLTLDTSLLAAPHTASFPDKDGTVAYFDDITTLESWVTSNFVPYTGASGDVDIGAYALQASLIRNASGAEAIGLDAGTNLRLYQQPSSYIQLYSGVTGFYANLDVHSLAANRTYTMPDQSGTLALLSDISGATASSTLLADFNLFSGDNTFSATTTMQKIWGMSESHIDTTGEGVNLSIYGGTASSSAVGGSSTGNDISIVGGYPEGFTYDGDGYATSSYCATAEICDGGYVSIYGGIGIEANGGGVNMQGGLSTSTSSGYRGGNVSIYGGEGDNGASGGGATIEGGQAFGTGSGGDFSIRGGAADSGNGGNFQMGGGYSALGYGGNVSVSGGEGSIGGGEVVINGGQANDSGNGGNVVLNGGDGTTQSGNILLGTTIGNVGIGTTSPYAKLSVQGTAGLTDAFAVASSTLATMFNVTANGRVGIGSSTPWGTLSIIDTAYDRQPGIVMATSTTDYPFWGTTASTSDALGDPVRMLVGWGTRFLTNFDTFAQLSVNGEINTHNTIALKCEGEGMKKNVQKITDTSGSVLSVTTGTACEDFSYIEDNGATFDYVAGNTGNYIRLRTGATAATTAAGDGAGIALTTAGLTTATNTPLKLEVSARPVTNVATSTLYVIGFTNTTGVNPNYAVMPTDGCGFVASTTQANWRIFCGKASAYTYVDSGIASTTNITTPANGAFTRFRVEMGKTYATFRYLRGSVGDANSWVTIGSISTNYPNTALLNPTAFVASIPIKSSDELQVRFIRAWYNDPEPY